MATKNLILLSTLFLALLSSCTQQKYATTSSSYENDEVYYQKGDTYITDYALVDNLPDQKPDTYVDPNQVDDYYDPSAQQYTNQNNSPEYADESYTDGSGNVTNNYYGDVYQDNNTGWGMNSPYYGNYGWNNWGPFNRLSWNPYTGWTYRFGWGYNNWGGCMWDDPWCWNNSWYGGGYYGGWGCGWNSSYYGWGSPYYGWSSPYYGWGYGNYYNINNYYGGGNWGNNDGGFGGGLVYGPRPTISVGSSVSSSYEGGTLGHHIGVYEPANNVVLANPSISSSHKPMKQPLASDGTLATLNQTGKVTIPENATKPLPAIEPVLASSPAGPTLSSNTASKPMTIETDNTGLTNTPIASKPAIGGNGIVKPSGDLVVEREPSNPILPKDPAVEADYFTIPRKPSTGNDGQSGTVNRPARGENRPYVQSNTTTPSNGSSTNRPASRDTYTPSNNNGTSSGSRNEKRPANTFDKPESRLEVSSPKPEVRMPKPEVSTPKPEVRTPKPEVRTPKPEIRTPKPESRPSPSPPSVKPPGGGGSRNSGGGNSGGNKGGGGGGTSPRKK